MIKLRDALAIMASFDEGGQPIPFDIEIITCSIKNKTGGERRTYKNAIVAGSGNSKKNPLKNPNHFKNWTRNIQVPERSRPITIQALLITRINGERVYL